MRLARTAGVAALAGAALTLALAAGGCGAGGQGGGAAGGSVAGGGTTAVSAGSGAQTAGPEGSYDPVRYGEQLFGNMCAGCHGEGARGSRASALDRPELAQKYPTDAALIRRVEEGDPATGMPPCPVGNLLPRQKQALAAYLRSLWR